MWSGPVLNNFLDCDWICRIPQKIRIAGSLTAILLVFLLTAILVKVDLEPLPFFIITMIKIICINCESLQQMHYGSRTGCKCHLIFDVFVPSVRSGSSGKSVRDGRTPASILHHTHHERTGTRRNLRCFIHDLRHRQWVQNYSTITTNKSLQLKVSLH